MGVGRGGLGTGQGGLFGWETGLHSCWERLRVSMGWGEAGGGGREERWGGASREGAGSIRGETHSWPFPHVAAPPMGTGGSWPPHSSLPLIFSLLPGQCKWLENPGADARSGGGRGGGGEWKEGGRARGGLRGGGRARKPVLCPYSPPLNFFPVSHPESTLVPARGDGTGRGDTLRGWGRGKSRGHIPGGPEQRPTGKGQRFQVGSQPQLHGAPGSRSYRGGQDTCPAGEQPPWGASSPPKKGQGLSH